MFSWIFIRQDFFWVCFRIDFWEPPLPQSLPKGPPYSEDPQTQDSRWPSSKVGFKSPQFWEELFENRKAPQVALWKVVGQRTRWSWVTGALQIFVKSFIKCKLKCKYKYKTDAIENANTNASWLNLVHNCVYKNSLLFWQGFTLLFRLFRFDFDRRLVGGSLCPVWPERTDSLSIFTQLENKT